MKNEKETCCREQTRDTHGNEKASLQLSERNTTISPQLTAIYSPICVIDSRVMTDCDINRVFLEIQQPLGPEECFHCQLKTDHAVCERVSYTCSLVTTTYNRI